MEIFFVEIFAEHTHLNQITCRTRIDTSIFLQDD